MTRLNYHIHTTGSDGKLSPEEVVEESIKAGMNYICFTDHYSYPKELKSIERKKRSNELGYYQELISLKKKFKDKIYISVGMEFDFFERFQDYTKKEILRRNYDFIIGSIHHIPKDDFLIEVPWSKEAWKTFIQISGSLEDGIKLYYKQVEKMVKSNLFDCVGHLDLIKIFYPDNWKKIESQKWYKKLILDLLDEILKKKMCIEINTSGWWRPCREQYPSEWIIKEAKRRNIPITIGSDGHHEDQINKYLNEGIKLAKKHGYKSVLIFHKRKPVYVKI